MKKLLMVARLGLCVLLLAGCVKTPTDPPLDSFRPVTANDLAGTYQGILEGVTVADLGTVGDPDTHAIVDLDLLHTVTMSRVSDMVLNIQSSIIPKTRAIVIGAGDTAVNVEFIEFEGLFDFPIDHEIHSLKVKNIMFVKDNHEWIFVMQIIREDFARARGLDGVYVYQYVSYPSSVAQQMGRDEAIRHVNRILKLASAAQRL